MDVGAEPLPDEGPVPGAWALHTLSALEAVGGVRRVGLAVLEGGGRRLAFTASDRSGVDGPVWCYVDAYDDVPLTRTVRTGEVVAGGLDQLSPTYADFVDVQQGTGSQAVAAVPISAAGQVLGGYVLFFDTLPDFTERLVQELVVLGAELGDGLRLAQRARARDGDGWTDDVAPGARAARHEVAPDPAAVRGARCFLRETLQEWGLDEESVESGVLCLSELVTNAVVHGAGRCSVRVVDESGVITVAVRNGGSSKRLGVTGATDPLAVHGRGLRLLGALSSRWGSDLRATGLTVWFVLDT